VKCAIASTQGPQRRYHSAMSIRSLTFAAVIALLGLAGHSLADGSLPGGTTIALVFGVSLALSVPAVSKRRSVFWAFLYLLGAQALVHVLVSFTHASHGSSSPWSMVLFHVGAAAVASIVLVQLDDVVARFTAWGRGILGVLFPLPVVPQGHLAMWSSGFFTPTQSVRRTSSTRAPPVRL